MNESLSTPEDVAHAFLELLDGAGLSPPDEIQPRACGGITCLWYDEKVAVIVSDEEEPGTGQTGRVRIADRSDAND